MKKKELFLLTLGIFMTAVAWLVADIYHASTIERIKPKINLPVVNKYDIDTEIFKILEQKNQ
ncbi:MAG: hypothetical protein QHH09_03010 [Microgenomates group bacterium]|nr:hypothetical protein [Microgenomates group bacterium]